ncbi:uncharacterized protein MELLADRAFT_63468 [Melampsora larici-populina 98AG31]|uniref:Uncharacterized protein n=1 Tax=Melampsora larici-populina (strain 98AG31 / pathotype 3-4-7) TaxID=747676 RepID=F4RMR4_MELLP|nr:uncharacterized protein MELLADRAFT_63468 [Melampsora larici-populina 98AG31]EGG06155.1 hypothetical protein MELLADRAFT_63468 [Melampsora larici-populina 98AG31]
MTMQPKDINTRGAHCDTKNAVQLSADEPVTLSSTDYKPPGSTRVNTRNLQTPEACETISKYSLPPFPFARQPQLPPARSKPVPKSKIPIMTQAGIFCPKPRDGSVRRRLRLLNQRSYHTDHDPLLTQTDATSRSK